MRLILIFAGLIALLSSANAQTAEAGSGLIVDGKVKKEIVFSLRDLQNFPLRELKNVNISCSPKKESKAKKIRVVLLKSVLDSVAFDYEKPKDLGHYYFLFSCADGYKVVFSFQEIYNSEIGNNLYLVVEKDGIKMEAMEERILLLSTKDIKAGSRNLKGLSRITLARAD